jgi:hypothetical protein
MAPLWFALIALAGVGLGELAAGGRRRAALALAAALALPGAAGLLAASQSTPASSLAQRGECYEWFKRQLTLASGGRDSPATAELFARVDRGDARFRTLRFRVSLVRTSLDDPRVFEKERRLREKLPPEVALFAAAHLGSLLGAQLQAGRPGGQLPWLRDPQMQQDIDALPAAEAAALLHGAGLGLQPPRIVDGPERVDASMQRLSGLLRALPARHAAAIAEGYGFALGAAFDPYFPQALELVALHARLPSEVQDPFYTGLGWGCRQRYLVPPTTLPDGLTVLDCVPEAGRAGFVRGFTGAVLPAEATAGG